MTEFLQPPSGDDWFASTPEQAAKLAAYIKAKYGTEAVRVQADWYERGGIIQP